MASASWSSLYAPVESAYRNHTGVLTALENALLIGFGLIFGGFALLVAELFIPSGGILSLISAVMAIAGVVVLFMGGDPAWGVIGLLTIIILGPIVGGFMVKIWPDTPIGRRLIHGEDGVDRDTELQEKQQQAQRALDSLIGSTGRAVTALRPSGVIEIDGHRYDALAETVAIDTGGEVRVVGAGFGTLKVRPA